MTARIRFIGRYGNGIAVALVGFAALIGIGQEGFVYSLLSAALVAGIALSVQAAERMAFVASEEDWHQAERRESELRHKLSTFTVRHSEA